MEKDFYNTIEKIVIASTFTDLTPDERKELRRYLIRDDFDRRCFLATLAEACRKTDY